MHLIKQHNITINCNSEQLGKSFKNNLSLLLETQFYPKLKQLLIDYDDEETIWTIENLPIALNNLSAKHWKTEFIDQSLNQIELFLKTNSVSKNRVGNIEVSEIPGVKITKKEHYKTLVISYLKTGLFIENSNLKSLQVLYNAIEINEAFIKKIKAELKGEIKAILRWSLNIPQHLKLKFLGTDGIIHDFVFAAKAIDRSPKLNEFLEFLYWMSYFNESATLLDERFMISIKTIAKQYYNIEGNYVDKLLFQNDKRRKKLDKRTLIEPSLENEKFDIKNPSAEKILKPETTLFIKNAGLVLLHPYFPKLFSSLGYQEKGEWKDVISQHRATLTLQYLVGFDDSIFENELVLNKLLCGVNLTDTVATKFEVTEEEKHQCENLLQAIINHWKILKSTSVLGLQESFIKRDGKLFLTEDNRYELTVENKAYDMLIDQLPWGIGMIKTPWMGTYLTCNWR